MKLSRRTLIGVTAFAGVGAAGIIALPRLLPDAPLLRPPGALRETKFLASCIKCGQCLQVCPYHSVKLLDINAGLAMGTPVITPAERGCYLCDLLPCVLSCPSGALDHAVSDARDVHMGIARVEAPYRCLALTGQKLSERDIAAVLSDKPAITEQEIELHASLTECAGKDCDICVRFCPYPDRELAIALVPQENGVLPQIRDKCVGCGVCEELCPADVILTIPSDREENL